MYMNDDRNNSFREKIILSYIFFALLQSQTVIAKKTLTSFEQPLATHLAWLYIKLDKAIHWVNHYPLRVTDFSGGY